MKVCYVCGAAVPDRDARIAHMAGVHPGTRVTWRGYVPVVIEPGGAERIVDKAAVKRMHRAAAAVAAGRPVGKRGPGRKVRIEDFGGGPSPAAGAILGGPESTSGPGVDGPPPSAPGGPTRIVQPPVHPTLTAVQGSVRDAVRDGLDVQMLATIIRDFSVNLSEADGAGEAGHLSLTQSMTIAKLAYDSVVDVIVDRFGGNVGRFKMALAVLVLLLSKGSVHARAIGAKVQARRVGKLAPVAPPPAVDDEDHADEYAAPIPDDEPAESIPVAQNGHATPDMIAELAERQARFRASPWAGDDGR
jgi:hypothetical protein